MCRNLCSAVRSRAPRRFSPRVRVIYYYYYFTLPRSLLLRDCTSYTRRERQRGSERERERENVYVATHTHTVRSAQRAAAKRARGTHAVYISTRTRFCRAEGTSVYKRARGLRLVCFVRVCMCTVDLPWPPAPCPLYAHVRRDTLLFYLFIFSRV